MKTLYATTAVIEAGAGLALMSFPSAAAELLLGAPLEAPVALTVARVGGAGLLTLGIACWLARTDTQSRAARGLVSAMVIYNIGASIILGAAGIGAHLVGMVLWPAVLVHVTMTGWCLMSLMSGMPAET